MLVEMTKELEARRRKLRRASRWLSGHGYEPAHVEMERIAALCRSEELDWDTYGEGAELQAFEARVAELLGLPAARFMPSGSMAQPIAMRLWSERERLHHFAMHPSSHIELHEQRGYRHLHGLDATLIGEFERPMLARDLESLTAAAAAVVIELPTRENGGQLPSWDELVELCELARSKGIHPHMDGARLWEAGEFYGKPLAEICALFDSVYVSFYKGIGALAGAMLLGPEDFIAEAATWQRRQGGNLYSLLPNWASASMRLEGQLGKFTAFRDRALEFADSLSSVEGLRVNPNPPQVNLFHLWFEGDAEELKLARDRVAEERGIWLFGGLRPTDLPNVSRTEIYIGESAMGIEAGELRAAFERLFELERGGS